MKALAKSKINDIHEYGKKKDYEVECNIKRDKNKLILEFTNEHNIVPYPVIGAEAFTIELKPTEEEIDCCHDCDTCLTPIC